jgi:hypothetical protein
MGWRDRQNILGVPDTLQHMLDGDTKQRVVFD